MTDTSTYGPSAIRTPANAVTTVRLLVSPVLFALISHEGASWVVFTLWTALALTDGLDGYIARRQGTTRSGAFLDPLADKVLVLGALVMLVSIDVFWWLPVALIGIREVAISVQRTYWSRRGLAIPATRLAKWKTLVQALAVGFALLPPTATDSWAWLSVSLLWVAVVLTLVSGLQYVVAGRSATTTMSAADPTT